MNFSLSANMVGFCSDSRIYDLDYSLFFTLADAISTRGHPFKIFKQQLLRDVRAHVFSQRIINSWNNLKQAL